MQTRWRMNRVKASSRKKNMETTLKMSEVGGTRYVFVSSLMSRQRNGWKKKLTGNIKREQKF